jgi:hypothetical protein
MDYFSPRILMHHRLNQNLLGLWLWAAAIMVASGEPASPAPENAEKPPFEVTATEIKLPGVTIDRATREVSIAGEVCLKSGILEYVICRPNTFEHEAIFTTLAKPELVHAALLLSGLKPTPQLRGMGDLWWEKAMQQPASRVKIEVEWKQDGALKRLNLTSLLQARDTSTVSPQQQDKHPQVKDTWIFAGSFLHLNKKSGKQIYAANSSGILVGIWPDPSTVIQYGLPSGNPRDGKDIGIEIYEERVPEVGTQVKLIFSRHPVPVEKADTKK